MKRIKKPIFTGHSISDDYLRNKANQPPQVSALMAQGVSQYRKEILAGEVAQGLYRDGSGPSFNENGQTHNANVVSLVGMKKQAQVMGSGGGNGFGGFGGGNTVKQIPEVYSPLWLSSNLNLPRDRATINAWCRAFYALNPFVHNAIQLHSTYPISKLSIKCPNPKIQRFFDEMIEELDLINICTQIAQEYWLLGEAFVHTDLDLNRGKWSRIMIQNPDYMIVKRTAITSEPIIMLKPDENLKNIVKSNRPSDVEQRKQLNQYIVDAVRRGENIPLDNFHVTHLARKISPYEIRGTGLPVCIFRQLMLFDKLRESKFAQADNLINPLTLVKIGGNGPDAQHPTFADLEAWRETFESAQFDKDFKVFTHPDVTVERVGASQGIYDTSPDITQLVKEIFIGLQVPPVLMDGAEITYANGTVSLDALRQRYMQFRTMLSIFLKRKIFAPISEIQGFYDNKDGKKQLIVPDIDWNHMSLFDTNDYIQNLVQLTQPGSNGEPGRASLHSLYRSLGLEWEDEQRKLRKEAIQSEIVRQEVLALKSLTLTELRALDENEDIPEPVNGQQTAGEENPVPGEMPGGTGAPDLGGLPGLGNLPAPPSAPEPPAPSSPPPAK